MLNILLTPPLAFLIYLPLVFAIFLVGKSMAGKETPSAGKSSLYASGEEAPTTAAAPGYRPFFLIAFFFAILHLGVLVVGSGSLNASLIPFVVGLVLALVALILG